MKISFDGGSILNQAMTAGISSDASGQVECSVWPRYLQLSDSRAPIASRTKIFAVFAEVADSSLSGLVKVLREFQVPCGFQVADAVFVDHIVTIGNTAALEASLAMLEGGIANVRVHRVKGKTSLQAKLQELHQM